MSGHSFLGRIKIVHSRLYSELSVDAGLAGPKERKKQRMERIRPLNLFVYISQGRAGCAPVTSIFNGEMEIPNHLFILLSMVGQLALYVLSSWSTVGGTTSHYLYHPPHFLCFYFFFLGCKTIRSCYLYSEWILPPYLTSRNVLIDTPRNGLSSLPGEWESS